jgi:sialic acid synthase SpsE
LLAASIKIHEAFSSNKEVIPEEDKTRRFAFHSVVSKKDINKNEVLNWKNLTTKRPGTGDFPSYKIYSLIGRRAKKYIKKNHLIKKEYIK